MPTFAELRAAAQNAASSGAQKANAWKDRHTSPHSGDTSYGRPTSVHSPDAPPIGKKPAPPPPTRKAAIPPPAPTNTVQSTEEPPPPPPAPRAAFRPTTPLASTSSYQPQAGQGKIDFRNLSVEEKQGLFSLLDEFFNSRGYTLVRSDSAPAQSRTAVPSQLIPSNSNGPKSSLTSKIPAGLTEKASGIASSLQSRWGKKEEASAEREVAHDDAPPPVLWARPSQSSTPAPSTPQTVDLPPEDPHTCSARTVSEYFSSAWSPSETWYQSDNPLPPILVNRQDMMWTASWSHRGTNKEVLGAAIFEDCSRITYRVAFDTRTGVIASKEGLYRPIPEPWDGELLAGWAESFGEIIAQFAERAEAEGRPVGRGECWDMANEAIRDIQKSYPDMPEPAYSTGRCHGHRIYYGRVGGEGTVGRWRGGDGVVRRGDIVEWRRVTIKDGFTTFSLGNPDHTAIVVSTSSPTLSSGSPPNDGDTLLPTSFGSLEVIEQSLGKAPKRQTYNLSGMQQGEVWIYRSVGMVDYLGGEFRAEWPPIGGEEFQG
ncbi:hypothetical protein BT69DRAFT_1293161 [Atractiella rhizophila]|nr:hypothetical protein BT69DRAFT_1293161 [Atractiella rhizophila]